MATTALFVEILVIGAIAEIWILMMLLIRTSTGTLVDFLNGLPGKELAPLMALPLIALTYALGWIINFLVERLMKVFGEHRKEERFGKLGISYSEAKALVYQKASEAALTEISFDRHIIRLARASFLNFSLIALGIVLNASKMDSFIAEMLAGLCLVLAVVSLWQWHLRTKTHHDKIADTFIILDLRPAERARKPRVRSPADSLAG